MRRYETSLNVTQITEAIAHEPQTRDAMCSIVWSGIAKMVVLGAMLAASLFAIATSVGWLIACAAGCCTIIGIALVVILLGTWASITDLYFKALIKLHPPIAESTTLEVTLDEKIRMDELADTLCFRESHYVLKYSSGDVTGTSVRVRVPQDAWNALSPEARIAVGRALDAACVRHVALRVPARPISLKQVDHKETP